jgi:hypothetical protein
MLITKRDSVQSKSSVNSQNSNFTENSVFTKSEGLESLNVSVSPEGNNYKYKRPIEYWLVIIGFAIGYGSFWRFPYLVYSCG